MIKKLLIIGLILLSIFLVSCTQVKEIEVIKEVDVFIEPLPPVDLTGTDFFENLYNDEEMFFTYWLANYGNKEVKDITVYCEMTNEADEILTTVTDFKGNLASNSIKYEESYAISPDNLDPEEYLYADCFIISCEECNILWENIPEIVKERSRN